MDQKKEIIWIPEDFNGETIEVAYRKGVPGKTKEEMEAMIARGERPHLFNFCGKLNPRTYSPEEGIICRQDVATKLRDGTTIYSDIYMPDEPGKKFPLIISWSPFSKRPAEGMKEWKLMGVPPGCVSEMAKFESTDPGYWCHLGYAIANVDPRGVGNSEGNVAQYGPQDGRDGYDYIEWAAQQDWCSGKVALFGNSGVAMAAARIAAEQPPHLACVGLWELTGDMYRESLAVGGIMSPAFNEDILAGIACKNYIEDLPTMAETHPMMDAYWESKIVKWDKIRVPSYVCSGWCHIHLRGSMEAFRRIRTPKKWLRAHREFEWPDTYHRDNVEDLTKFYDRYLKNVRNGWEFTPKVRIDVMDAYDFDYASARREDSFPIERTQYKKLYLNAADMAVSCEPFPARAEVSYDPMKESVIFDYRFAEDTEITGYMKLKLWLECRGYDDMDLFVWVKKNGQGGEHIPVYAMHEPYRGVWGYMRASHREIDPKWATDYQPVQSHRNLQKLSPGEIVPVEVEMYPHSRMWHKGETLRIEITGRFVKSDWFEDPKVNITSDNGDGIHVIHTGGEYDSFLQIPVIPPKYTSGDYVYRG